MAIRIEEAGARVTGVCSCCGSKSRVVWGYAHNEDVCVAAHYVHWTLGRVRQHGANFDLILGPWGNGAKAADRRSVSLEYRVLKTGPWFMVIDAAGRPFTSSSVAGQPLARPDVIGTPLADLVFAVIDVIVLTDTRLKDLARTNRRR